MRLGSEVPFCVLAMICCGLLTSCGPSTMNLGPGATPRVQTTGRHLLPPGSTIDLENSDRIARFQRLAQMAGVPAPTVVQTFAPAGTVPGAEGRVPVVQVTYPEGVFFATNSAQPLPQARQVIALIAANMRRDVPDAALTVVGNTDSTGSAAYNDWLSIQRAEAVKQMLVAAGMNPAQISTVGMGDRQPVAPNSTPQGRALNRRVEFLISAARAANLSALAHRRIDTAYLSSVPATPMASFSPQITPPASITEATPSAQTISGGPNPSPVAPASAPPLAVGISTPRAVAPAPLTNYQTR